MDEITSAILTFMDQMKVRDSEQYTDAVLKRLESFGYKVTKDNAWLIAFSIQKVSQHIMNSCNTSSVPDGLFFIAVDRACGEFLGELNSAGLLELDGLDLDGAISQIREGDATVQFTSGLSDDEKFIELVNYLKTEGAGDEVCYRKLKW